jgi:hypothetical protein
MTTKNLINFNCKKCKYISHRKHNLIRHMISKHQDEDEDEDEDKHEDENENKEYICEKIINDTNINTNDVSVSITTNDENSILDSKNKVHVKITSNENKENIIKDDNHKCNKCKKYFYTHKSLLKHNKECKIMNIKITKDRETDKEIVKPNDEPLFTQNSKHTQHLLEPISIPGINLKLLKIKEKLFDIIHFLMFEKTNEETNIDTEKIYKNIYKTITSCISNILIDEQNIYLNISMPPSPISSRSNSRTSRSNSRTSRSNSRTAMRRRDSWTSN